MKYLMLLLILGLGMGCAKDIRPKKPDNLIAKEQMVNVLYDIAILNAAKGALKNVLEEEGIYPQKYLFEKHKIDSLQFAQSNDYYSYDVSTYEEIIDQVNAKIEAQRKIYEDKVDKEAKRQQRKKDSIRKLSDRVNQALIKPDVKAKTDTTQ
ncbi:DUF4296 domain-containing protein [Subsaximicrobium wynnwilliamsii]|uniref:DUF4296 domain-containing protein n=1 Tax=Subsaximicrobium wynnwilliamsii TaxID=291179 RepID=A0A5C6ZF55_9FLAO|nr:DUF4296 domain-containing protein [Subsaximicrobium wynnwilliamsii]TXD82558.1 DUF4296 domain-containing protein [Subsaximicrobium wynnwilliamsii]TXD88201.1 DUF4296 domain-containing protein [Subsaximicrobium wynnwilliamsii]TXE02216.1 DUF4296 domain-containing protein [Subsaximicrobium wynnwilliamsii]